MRGCLIVLAAGVAFLAVLAWFALPPVAATVVAGGLATSGLSGTGTSVQVHASPPYELLDLHADAIDIASSDVSWRGISASGLTLHLSGVDLGARAAESVVGRLDGVSIPVADGSTPVERIDLAGPSSAIGATLALDPTTTSRLATAAVEKAIGRAPTAVQLIAPDRVVVTIGSQRADGRLLVDQSGAVVVSVPPLGTAVVADPATDLPLVLRSVAITPGGGATLIGTLDPRALGLSR